MPSHARAIVPIRQVLVVIALLSTLPLLSLGRVSYMYLRVPKGTKFYLPWANHGYVQLLFVRLGVADTSS